MNKILAIAIIVVATLLLLVGAFFVGVFYQLGPVSPAESATAGTVLKVLSSKAVITTYMQGKVIKINEKDLKISAEGDDVIIGIGPETIISSSVNYDALLLSQIKVGDTADVYAKLLATGEFTAESIIIQK